MPKFEEVALMLRDVDALSVMKADVTEFEYEELQENLNVSRVPAIKLFGKHSATPLTMLPQDPFDMHFAVKEKLGLRVPNKCLFGESDAETVTSSTWDKIVMDPTQSVLVQFYAPWCPHCKRFLSTYNSIARKLTMLPGVQAVRVNADEDKILMGKYGIKTLPPLMIFSKRNKTGTLYELPEATQHLEMVQKVIERLQQPESDEEMEADARALLQRVKAQQKAGNVQEAIIDIAQSTGLNVTAVWRGEIVSLQP